MFNNDYPTYVKTLKKFLKKKDLFDGKVESEIWDSDAQSSWEQYCLDNNLLGIKFQEYHRFPPHLLDEIDDVYKQQEVNTLNSNHTEKEELIDTKPVDVDEELTVVENTTDKVKLEEKPDISNEDDKQKKSSKRKSKKSELKEQVDKDIKDIFN